MSLKKIIVAIDTNKISESIKVIKELKKDAFAFKVGYEFFFNLGLDGYKEIQNEKIKIFLDLKLHDIPNTVNNGIKAISKLKPYFTTIHLSGGDEMQKSAIKSSKKTKILGVSILTSLNSNQIKKYYFNESVENIISKFAKYALLNRLDGVVCSPKEIHTIKKISSNKLLIVTPGIRPSNFKNFKDDQKRTMTPREAIDAGANYLVIGRPITKSQNPLRELKLINSQIV